MHKTLGRKSVNTGVVSVYDNSNYWVTDVTNR